MTDSILDRYLSSEYNCAHYVADVWEHETGQDIRPVLSCFLTHKSERSASLTLVHSMRRIPRPTNPCIVLFRRVKATPHVGIFLRGRVLHLTDKGPIRQLLDVARIGYTSVRFYEPR